MKVTNVSTWIAILATTGAAVVALIHIFNHSGDRDAVSIIWLWGALMGWCALRSFRHTVIKVNGVDKTVAWGLLGIVIIGSQLMVFTTDVGWFLLVCALVAFGCGLKLLFPLLPSLFLWLLVVPMLSYFQFLISYPLRLISSYATVLFLQLVGIPAGGSGTIIYLGNQRVAVTAACSGIEQLEAMLLVGWIIVMCCHRSFRDRLFHFVLILPVILFCNVIRLMVTLIVLYYWGAAVAFNDSFHYWIGIATVIAVALVFLALGWLFQNRETLSDKKL